jgi:glucokinase
MLFGEQKMDMTDMVLGIDFGGTNIRIGSVCANGSLSNFYHEPVNRSLSGDQIVEWIGQRIKALYVLEKIHAVAVGLAGMVLHNQILKPGLVVLPSLGNYPLSERLSARLNKPCWVGNDASAALRGEVHFGAARCYRNVLLLTLGTGIGGGLLLDGKLREGTHGSSVEIGLFKFGYPSDGTSFSIEALYSPGAVMQRLNAPNRHLFELVQEGNSHARQLKNEMLHCLGMLIANIHLLLDLELVLISGGLANAGEELLIGLRNEFQRACPAEYQFGLKIEAGSLPVDTAGVVGAASVWFERAGLLPSLELKE